VKNYGHKKWEYTKWRKNWWWEVGCQPVAAGFVKRTAAVGEKHTIRQRIKMLEVTTAKFGKNLKFLLTQLG
jgi:hypothetical protein